MTFTPYTKDAITRIKNGATAAELGWDVTFYTRVCREHGLPQNVLALKTHVVPVIADAPTISCAEAKRPGKAKKPDAAPIAAAPASAPRPEPETTFVEGWILNLTTRFVTAGAASVQLSKQQVEVLRIINKGSSADPMNGRRIAQRVGVSSAPGNVGNAVSVLRAKLAPLRLNITSRAGRINSGYWLTDAKGLPAKLRIAGALMT